MPTDRPTATCTYILHAMFCLKYTHCCNFKFVLSLSRSFVVNHWNYWNGTATTTIFNTVESFCILFSLNYTLCRMQFHRKYWFDLETSISICLMIIKDKSNKNKNHLIYFYWKAIVFLWVFAIDKKSAIFLQTIISIYISIMNIEYPIVWAFRIKIQDFMTNDYGSVAKQNIPLEFLDKQ